LICSSFIPLVFFRWLVCGFGFHRHENYPYHLYVFPLLLLGIGFVVSGINLYEKVRVTQKIGQFLIAFGVFTFSLAFLPAMLFTGWNELTNWFVGTGWGTGVAEHYNWFFGYYGVGVDGIARGTAYYIPFPSGLLGIYLLVCGLVLCFVKKRNPSALQPDRSHEGEVSEE
jgi:hypothetical protein